MATKKQIYDQILLDFANEFNISINDLGSNYQAFAAVLATTEYNLQLRLNNIKKNVWVGSADIETLLTIGREKIGRVPFPAVAGVYTCSTVAIPNQSTIIPEGTKFQYNGFVFEVLMNYNPGDDIQLRSLNTGTDSALEIGDILTSTAPLPSINDKITVLSINISASDAEDIEDYRADVVNSFILKPSGGNAADYITWASDVSDIRTVYPYAANNEPGKINVYCEGISSFQPNSAKIDEVIDVFKYDSNGFGRVAVDLFPFINDSYIVPVQITNVDITLEGGEASQQSAAESVIEDYLYNIRPYLYTLNKIRDPKGDTITQSALIKELADAGINFTSLTISVKPLGGAPQTVTDYRVGDANDPNYYGEIPVFQTLTINT